MLKAKRGGKWMKMAEKNEKIKIHHKDTQRNKTLCCCENSFFLFCVVEGYRNMILIDLQLIW